MGFTFRPAAAPPPSSGGAFAKLPQFVGKLVVVVPYEDNIQSKFKDQNGRPQFQTRAKVVPVQSGSWTNPDNGEEAEWEAGEVLDVFISASRVRRQISELHVPVLGKLLKDGKAWVLQPPTEAEVKKAESVLASVDLPDMRGTAPTKTDSDDSNAVPW